ncbi:unnamed protein product [Larinioides sclopetarius]|uniref:Uncharacterized protein n=1 Tax=Larinioides sclopetarius TaxID=280406 RepID=A0AAV2AI01_9ARAC
MTPKAVKYCIGARTFALEFFSVMTTLYIDISLEQNNLNRFCVKLILSN